MRLLAILLCSTLVIFDHCDCEQVDYIESREKYWKGKIVSTSWSNCGSSSDPIQVQSLILTPDTIHIPGDFVLTASVNISSPIEDPAKAEIVLHRKTVFGWIRLPCIDEFGSCEYDDVCNMTPAPGTCPAILEKYHIPCHCPIPQGVYSVNNLPLTIRAHVPHWLEKGHYKAQIKLSENGYELGCYEIETRLN